MNRYTCIGSVRGCCGHKHRSLKTAARCLDRDIKGCRKQGGYSDRYVRFVDGSRLDEAQSAKVDWYLNEERAQ